ncbi:MAG: polysaccharide biosynthesis tyrosine autokinase [Actinomycetota bacterium]|nr:polysaccharide biosynthesis tyrosine autokinase [Actinomycetota bacterium]
MDLKAYLAALRQRWMLVVACMLACTGAAAGVTFTTPPVYESHTELFVSTSEQGDVSQAYQGGLFSQQRVKSYAQLVSSPLVTQRVIDRLELQTTPDALRQSITASAPIDTVLIQVAVRDREPERARNIARVLGREFIRVVDDLETPEGSEYAPVKVTIVKPAQVSSLPVAPNIPLQLTLGVLLGVALGVGAAMLLTTLDTSIRTVDDVTAHADVAVIGSVSDDPRAARRPLVVQDEEWSARAEAYRQLRTNVRFASIDRTLRSLVISSAVAGEGKTTTAANLAITLAQSGQSVIVVDADLRRPAMTSLLGLNPAVGLTNVLVDSVAISEALQEWQPGLPLRALASGPTPPNPSELLGSRRMGEVLAQLTAIADVVIFDTPPLLPVTDAAVLAAGTDGVLLVSRSGRVKRAQLASSVLAVRGVGANLLGVVLNGVPRQRGRQYGSYAYSYTPLHGTDGQDAGRRSRRQRRRDSVGAGS